MLPSFNMYTCITVVIYRDGWGANYGKFQNTDDTFKEI